MSTLSTLGRTAVLAAALLVVLVPTAAAQLPPGVEDLVDASEADRARFLELVAGDGELSFAPQAGFRPDLVSAGRTPRERAAAIYALGASGQAGAAGLLSALYGKVGGPEEVALIHALAGLEPFPGDVLFDPGRLVDPAHVGHLAAALVLSGDADALALVLRMRLPETPLGRTIDAAHAFARDPASAPPVATLVEMLELRLEAAKRFGRVGGEPWRARRLRELGDDEAWLTELIVPLGAGVDRPWTRDHLLEWLLAEPGPALFEAAVAHLGQPLVELVESGVWTPRGRPAWDALLDAVEGSDTTVGFSSLLERALQQDVPPPVRERAACTLFAVGRSDRSDAIVRDLLGSDRRAARLLALRAVADSALVEDPAFFEPYAGEEVEPPVRAVALVATLLRAPGAATDRVRDALIEDERLRAPVVEELVRRSDSRATAPYLALAANLPGLPDGLLLDVHAALLRLGVESAAAPVRTALAAGTDGAAAGRALLALARLDPVAAQDAAVDALLFGTDPDYTVAAGRLLVEARHPIGTSLLRRALWIRDVPTSQLAAGYLVAQEGLTALEREADSPPEWAREADLRRLGLALGEWGGYGEVQRLARSRNLRDPVLQGAYLGALASRTR